MSLQAVPPPSLPTLWRSFLWPATQAREFWDLESLGIAVEGVVVLELGSTSMATALSLLVACYYVFNIMYPTKCSNAFLFCEAALLEISLFLR